MRRSKILYHFMSNVGMKFHCTFVFRMSSVHFWANYLYSLVQACFYFTDLVELFPESFLRLFLFILSVLLYILFFFSSSQSKDIMLIMTEKTWLNPTDWVLCMFFFFMLYKVQLTLIASDSLLANFKRILDQEPMGIWLWTCGSRSKTMSQFSILVSSQKTIRTRSWNISLFKH